MSKWTQYEEDKCGCRWYPLAIAIQWPIGSSVVCRRESRENGRMKYSLFERWQGAGAGEFENTARFMRLGQ